MHERFRHFAQHTAEAVGKPATFLIAVMVVVFWAASGPIFHFSDTWQLVINTSTTIVTFLMVFLIQNTQNRDAQAIHLKLDELIRATDRARTGLVGLEFRSEDELKSLERQFERLHKHVRRERRKRGLARGH
jgi:low affinity Fe/Cu permease